MRTAHGLRSAMMLAAFALLPSDALPAQQQAVAAPAAWTAEELENLLAPVALYPDPILAQVLVAASYPDELELAARHVQLYGTTSLDQQPWDISVRAVAHYPPVLNLMADRPDWVVALGQAYAQQPGDVMDAVQSLRGMARAQGNLVTTAEQQVVVQDQHIRILPARPQVVYVPVYDPFVVYHRPIWHMGVYRTGWSFGVGWPVGVWLTYDLDWRHRYVYYHGWDVVRYRHGWFVSSRPFIVINHIYVRPRPTIVVVNHTIVNRHVGWDRFDRYNYVHRRVTWVRPGRAVNRHYAGNDRRDDGRDDRGRGPSWDRDGRSGNDRGRAVGPNGPGTVARNDRMPATTPRNAQPRPDQARTAQPRTNQAQPSPASAPARTQPQRQPSWNPRGDAGGAVANASRQNGGGSQRPQAAPQRSPTASPHPQAAPQRPQAAPQRTPGDAGARPVSASRPSATPRGERTQATPRSTPSQASTPRTATPRNSASTASSNRGSGSGGGAARGSARGRPD